MVDECPLIPEGCRVNWNSSSQRYYVFKSKYVYDPEKKRGREVRTQVGVVVDGKFRFAKSYLLKQQVKELSEAAGAGKASGEKTPLAGKPDEKIRDGMKEIVDSARKVKDKRRQSKVAYPLDYVYLMALLASLSGRTSCVQMADFWAGTCCPSSTRRTESCWGSAWLVKRRTKITHAADMTRGLDLRGCIVAAVTDAEDKRTGAGSSQMRLFITSLRWGVPLIAERAARAVRRHWSVENELHHVLDVDFQQDRTQCKNANHPHNRILQNKFAAGVLNKLQERESEKPGAEPLSKRRLMSRLCSARAALDALAVVCRPSVHA